MQFLVWFGPSVTLSTNYWACYQTSIFPSYYLVCEQLLGKLQLMEVDTWDIYPRYSIGQHPRYCRISFFLLTSGHRTARGLPVFTVTNKIRMD